MSQLGDVVLQGAIVVGLLVILLTAVGVVHSFQNRHRASPRCPSDGPKAGERPSSVDDDVE